MRRASASTVKFSLVQGGYWMGYCIAISYAAVYLRTLGCSNARIGVVLAVGNTLSFLLGSGLAAHVDRRPRRSLLRVLCALLALQLVCLGVLILTPDRGAAATVAFAGYIAFSISVYAMELKLCVDLNHAGVPTDFGTSRGVGALAYVLLATMRGIPQVLYGDEYAMMSANQEDPNNHSYLRAPLPLGKQVTAEMHDMYDFQSKLFNWRKEEKVVHDGKTMHFLARDNTYAFFRYNDDEAVFVFANAAEEPRVIPVEHYQEILHRYAPVGFDVMTGETVDMSGELKVPELSTLIVKLVRNEAAGGPRKLGK